MCEKLKPRASTDQGTSTKFTCISTENFSFLFIFTFVNSRYDNARVNAHLRANLERESEPALVNL